MMKCEWILCPVCGSKTRNKIRKDTVLENYPLYCPKCRQERYLKEQTHQIKKTIFGWVILLYPKLPSEFVFKFGGIFLCPFFGQLSICSYEAKFINT